MALIFLSRLIALFALIYLSALCKISVKAEEEDVPVLNVSLHDPAQIVAKALLCFNDKYIYESCEESYRLSASGNLNVPAEQTEAYCEGPCLSETHLVLHCLDNILTSFVFYNRATIEDVRDTIHAGCGYGPERGHFNVLEHLETEENDAPGQFFASRVVIGAALGFLVVVVGHGFLFV